MGGGSMSVAELVVVGLMTGMLVIGLVMLARRPVAVPQPSPSEWQLRLASMPQPADLQAIGARLTAVERLCDVVRAEMSGVKDAMNRVERTTDLLLKRQMEGDPK